MSMLLTESEEKMVHNIIVEELTKSDMIDVIKKNKDVEKKIRSIVKDVIIDMYRVLYQHSNIFTTLGK